MISHLSFLNILLYPLVVRWGKNRDVQRRNDRDLGLGAYIYRQSSSLLSHLLAVHSCLCWKALTFISVPYLFFTLSFPDFLFILHSVYFSHLFSFCISFISHLTFSQPTLFFLYFSLKISPVVLPFFPPFFFLLFSLRSHIFSTYFFPSLFFFTPNTSPVFFPHHFPTSFFILLFFFSQFHRLSSPPSRVSNFSVSICFPSLHSSIFSLPSSFHPFPSLSSFSPFFLSYAFILCLSSLTVFCFVILKFFGQCWCLRGNVSQ